LRGSRRIDGSVSSPARQRVPTRARERARARMEWMEAPGSRPEAPCCYARDGRHRARDGKRMRETPRAGLTAIRKGKQARKRGPITPEMAIPLGAMAWRDRRRLNRFSPGPIFPRTPAAEIPRA
jgi:hypothetical protein